MIADSMGSSLFDADNWNDIIKRLDGDSMVQSVIGPEGPTQVADHGKRRLTLTKASSFRPARVRWLWDERFPLGEITLIPGREGVGKSLFLAWMAAELTHGRLPGEYYGKPKAVLYAASEDSWTYTIAPRLIAAGADLDLVYRLGVETGDPDSDLLTERLTMPLDCHLVPEAAREVDAAALMLDPIVSLIDSRLSVNQSHELRRALEPLRKAAEEAQIAIPALVHFNKAVDADVLSKIPGARAWAEVARAAFGLAEDKEEGQCVASQIKNNLGRKDLPNLGYRIESVKVETDDGPSDVGKLIWTGEVHTGVEEVLSRRQGQRDVSDNTAAVIEFVEAQGYPMKVADIAEEFPDIKRDSLKKTLQRAAGRGELSNPTYGHYGPAKAKRDT